jgi:excinuclease ABC subunit A
MKKNNILTPTTPPDQRTHITVVGAREHNLKNITVTIPKETLTVITGPSGSGKSTLALDVLYAEGQRRYTESLSTYARQFLGIQRKPDVDQIIGLCPAIAVEQKTVSGNPRSTVGTITELYDYLRVLFARIGTIACPQCHQPITPAQPDDIATLIIKKYNNSSVTITAPIVQERKGEFTQDLIKLYQQGFTRFIIDQESHRFTSIDEIKKIKIKKTYKHSIDVIIDKIEATTEEYSRIVRDIVQASNLTHGLCAITSNHERTIYSNQRMCIGCGIPFPELEPRLFSFNSPIGACQTCNGLGVPLHILMREYFSGITHSNEHTCPTCHGTRLNTFAQSVTIDQRTIVDCARLSVTQARTFFSTLQLPEHEKTVSQRLMYEIISRYSFLEDVGLGYLTIDRAAGTLSGGEGQRIRLATQIGSALSGVLYVLDEPSIGLHQRDNDRLITTLHKLRDQGNTVVVVEHDIDTIRAADYVIDMGPAAGIHGGQVIAVGTPHELEEQPASLTGAYLSGAKKVTKHTALRNPQVFLTLHDAHTHNLKHIDIAFPLQVLCCISGVSGSGKSTLIMEELVPALNTILQHKTKFEVSKISGANSLSSIVVVDQSPIGRTPHSNPATYLGIFDIVRALFASLPESNARGYQVGQFSFNTGQGRCQNCQGRGALTIPMHFLPDVVTICPTCKGTRYTQETLDITYRGKNIADILTMTIEQAQDFFQNHAQLHKKLSLLCDIGLDYITLGQPSTTLSGGEAQRIKLAYELTKRGKNTLYILDEPTTGLHPSDIHKLLLVFDKLLELGNSLIVIEHNLDVLKTADYIIDLGPEGGDLGGNVVVAGTPQEVIECTASHTGHYLKRVLQHAGSNESNNI